jgi:hypothetical protein
VPTSAFTIDEISAFEDWFHAGAMWRDWHRRIGAHGEDVIEMIPQGGRLPTLQVAKIDDTYLATGFDGWGLTVCDDFDELLGILAAWCPRPRAAASRAAASRAA